MKKLPRYLRSFMSHVKSISLMGLLILCYSLAAQSQSSSLFFSQNQFDSKTNYPLVFLNPQAATQPAAAPVWETIQAVSIAQPIGPNIFAKPVSLNLDQVRNGSADDPVVPPAIAPWVNGNAGASNAHYVEGYSIPYRLVFENLVGTGLRSVDIEWDIRHSGANAIDFITNFDLIDYPAGSHQFSFGHPQEVINPLTEDLGSISDGDSPDIIKPNLPTLPGNTFDAIQAAGKGKFGIWGADIVAGPGAPDGLKYVTQGGLTGAQSSTRLRIYFENTGPTVIISWGGHIAKGADWGEGNSASAVSGSPYHTRLIEWDPQGDDVNPVSVGNQDRSLSAEAVIDPPQCDLGGDASVECNTNNTYTSGLAASDLSADMDFAWSIIDGSSCGASINATPTVSSASVYSGTKCNCSFTVRFTLLKNDVEISHCDKVVTTTDSDAPAFTFCPTSAGPIDCPATPSAYFGTPTATDNCSTPTITSSDATTPGSCANNYTVTRRWTARDACNNTATCSQSVVVRDVTAPSITCPADATVDCNASTTVGALGSATATDACGPTTVNSSDQTNTAGCRTVITRTWTARDACGNTATCVQYIIKKDLFAPTITCNVDGSATASDNCTGGVVLFLSNGTWTAIDESGNISTKVCPVGGGAGRLAPTQITAEQQEQQLVTEETVVTEEKTKAALPTKGTVQDVRVQAIPNPFNDKVKFVVTSPRSGYGTLEVMNMLGQKVKTVYQGQIKAGGQSFEMSLPSGRFQTLLYILKINGKQVTGKLIQAGTKN